MSEKRINQYSDNITKEDLIQILFQVLDHLELEAVIVDEERGYVRLEKSE